jgi:hypothetical protein
MIPSFLHPIIRYLARIAGTIHAPFSHKEVTSKDFAELLDLCAPGDIVLTHTKGELTNLLIPGFWKHAAMVSTDKDLVIEAVGQGVKRTCWFDFLRTKDYLVLVRPDRTPQKRFDAARQAETLLGLGYDYEFESGDKEFYCSELVNVSYGLVGKRLVPRGDNILPSDFSFCSEVYRSVSYKTLVR